MASLKSLTDDDLRQKLRQYGITSPVTATTRDILVKKLNHAIANQKKSPALNRTAAKSANRRLHTFSSDEDEDDESSSSSTLLLHPISGRPSSRFSRSRRDSAKSGAETPVSDRNGAPSSSGLNGNSGSGSSSSDHRNSVRRFASVRSTDPDLDDLPLGSGRSRPHLGGRQSEKNNISSLLATRRLAGSSSVHSEEVEEEKEDPLALRTRLPSSSFYPAVSARTGISPRAKIHDDYDTGSDSDLADDAAAAVDLSKTASSSSSSSSCHDRENSAVSNNGSFSIQSFYKNHKSGMSSSSTSAPSSTSTSSSSPSDHLGLLKGGDTNYFRKRKVRHSYLENGRRHDEDECSEEGRDVGGKSFGAAESVVTQTSPPGSNHEGMRVANGRHLGESSSSPLDHSPGDESTWHYSIPLLLLVLLVVFFVVVATLYVNMRIPLLPMLQSVPAMIYQTMATLPVPFLARTNLENQSQTGASSLPTPPDGKPPSPTPENRMPLCSNGSKTACLTVQEMSAFKQIAGRLEDVVLPMLQQQEGQYQCGESSVRYISVRDMQSLLQDANIISQNESNDGVIALGKLVEMNRHWGMEAVKEGEALLGISLVSPPTHIFCHIRTAIYNFLNLIIGLVLVIGACWLTFTYVKYHRRKKELEKQQVLETVEQILETLGGLARPGGKDYVAVNHVRDSLIGPRDRKAKQDIWKKAVTFIDNYESRIRREIQSVGGEDCEIWRWTSGVPFTPNTSGLDGASGRPPAKMWQGQAFESLETTHNLPNVSPTSCLKIRNMFDCDVEFGESWTSRIQDSILEKCEGISIVHIAVDRGSREGCVYLKCASLSEAGKAFRALHGWWYDGNLVTVKFLRDERYHHRFPNARHATRWLRPSNNKRLSLQVPTRQSDSVEHP
ncbi:uncharacterized protein LOC135218472 [Macrobrachium nipponense]|uniref:uncharacterized protein LOC135218472 n=1 Tax=Macrobrachium nipponense TaxID=159736 RepID=UPI0030C80565